MIAYDQIRDVHLEAATLCNASCPWCPRTFWGYPHNGGYPELYLTIDNAKKIFSPDFLRQLNSIRINGNFGDIVMNPDGADIVEYFREMNNNLKLTVSSNGGARDKKFWQRLARAGAHVFFAIDGLADTHHLYRQNTVWTTVLRNAKNFLAAGGRATWQMIKFKHNEHQISECERMSKQLGFENFSLVDNGRNTAPVFDRKGQLTHVLGDYRGETNFKVLWHKKQTDHITLEDVLDDRKPKKSLNCETKRMSSIYISANGDVSPCCYMGYFPATYGRGQYHEAVNFQLNQIVSKNNALEYPLEQCIQWFLDIEKSWRIDNYQEGRLLVCDDNCGSN